MKAKEKTQELEFGWKVCHTIQTGDEQLYMSSEQSGKSKVIYTFDEFVRPRKEDGPLTVFTSRTAAKNYVGGMKDEYKKVMSIIPCLYEPSKESRVWTRLHKDVVLRYLLVEKDEGMALAKRVLLIEWKGLLK